ncbi:MAG: NupC/NupG family nucleoside CNT transporter [Deltaproteobacteria bacterium]|nr:NupC/NupG family nucleoside CNT transporter [Deltaproteobacteria bacterium]
MLATAALALFVAAPAAALGETPTDPPPPTTAVADAFAPLLPTAAPSSDPAAELARGETLLRLGLLAEAAHAFRAVVAVTPREPRAWEHLRRVAIEARRTDVLQETLVALVDLYLGPGPAEDRTLAELRFEELRAVDADHEAVPRLTAALGRTGVAASGTSTRFARLRSLFGLAILLGLAYLLSHERRRVRAAVVAWGLGLQVAFAMLILWTPPGRYVFELASAFVYRVLHFTDDGARFVFGKLYQGLGPGVSQGPVQVVDGTSGDFVNLGMIFAIHVLPTIVFFSALMGVLYHWRLIQRLVRAVAWVMIRTMRTSGSESLCAAANIFLGQTEAPLVVRPYVAGMTRSELMAMMVGGFATISAGVLGVYAQFGIDPGHLLAASVMSAPASLLVAKILLPETEISQTQGGQVKDPERTTANVIDAAAGGASDGMRLALNVAAMLMAFLGLIAMLNWGLGFVGTFVGAPELSLKMIFGYLFYPLSWCLGVDNADLLRFGNLVGTMISMNEFVAYLDLSRLTQVMSHRSVTIATYALCGFANLGSVGIQIGGIAAIAPERRGDLAQLGLKAMLGGLIASWITACIAGVLI